MQFQGTPQQWRKVVERVELLQLPICWSKDAAGKFRAETTEPPKITIDWWPSTGTVCVIGMLSADVRAKLISALINSINNAIFEE